MWEALSVLSHAWKNARSFRRRNRHYRRWARTCKLVNHTWTKPARDRVFYVKHLIFFKLKFSGLLKRVNKTHVEKSILIPNFSFFQWMRQFRVLTLFQNESSDKYFSYGNELVWHENEQTDEKYSVHKTRSTQRQRTSRKWHIPVKND